MFCHIIAAVKVVADKFRDFIVDPSKFTRSRKWYFEDFLIFMSFRNGTTNRHEIKRYAMLST